MAPHYDVPQCVLIHQMGLHLDQIQFYDQNKMVHETTYRTGLLNTKMRHGVMSICEDRVYFKISIMDMSYFQMREILIDNITPNGYVV